MVDMIARLRGISGGLISAAAEDDRPLSRQIKTQNAKVIAEAAAELTSLRAKVEAADKLAVAMKHAVDSLGWAEAHLKDAGVKSANVTYGERSARAALSAYEAGK